MLDVVKPEDLQAIIVRLMLAAQQGDVAAARLVLAYTLGKPARTVDPDALDLAEWQLWQQMPVPPETLAGLLGPLQVPLACNLARTVLPLLQDAVARQLAQQLAPTAPPPPGTDPAQPQAMCPVVPEARPASDAQTERTTPNPTPEQPSRPGQAKPKGKPEGANHSKTVAGQAVERGAGLAAANPGEGPADPQAELTRWLQVCERFLSPPALPTVNRAADTSAFPQEPVFQT